jgi:cyclic dehypoxanthinyl futalosine synthase
MGISTEQALDCFKSDDLIGIGMEADAVRRRLHPEGVVSYSIERRIDYTPFAGSSDLDGLYAGIGEVLDLGGTGVQLQGRVPAGVGIIWFESLFGQIKRRFPSLWLHCLSASEVLAISAQSGLALHETLTRLRAAGLDSIPGTESAPAGKFEAWLTVHRTAHQFGLPSTAVMRFGGEPVEERVRRIEAIRALQDETGGFIAFLPIPVQPGRSSAPLEEATAVEYLKTLAISRIVLDNIENIQSDWTTQGLKVLQMGLRFGGNDAGSALPQDAAATTDPSEEDLRRIIRDAGFHPVQRDTLYRTMFLN